MRLMIQITLLVALESTTAFSQSVTETSSPQAKQNSYSITLTEMRLNSGADPKSIASAADPVGVLKQFDSDGKIDLVEFVRCTVDEGQQSTLTFGRQVSRVVGVTQSQAGKSRNLQQLELGTGVEILASDHNGKIAVKFSYQSSRHDGQGTEDSPPDIETSHYKATLVLESGTTVLVGGNSNSYLLITVRK